MWRSYLEAAEDRNYGWCRITAWTLHPWRSPSRAAEDRNFVSAWHTVTDPIVAVALRGGRGSQQGCPLLNNPAASWRSRFGAADNARWWSPSRAAEDLNDFPLGTVTLTPMWRSPSRAAEDRNPSGVRTPARTGMVAVALTGGRDRNTQASHGRPGYGRWRSPSRAAEDRNPPPTLSACSRACVAVALSGGRGSQPVGTGAGEDRHDVAVALWVAEDRNVLGGAEMLGELLWQSTSRAAEDRNTLSNILLPCRTAVVVAGTGDRHFSSGWFGLGRLLGTGPGRSRNSCVVSDG